MHPRLGLGVTAVRSQVGPEQPHLSQLQRLYPHLGGHVQPRDKHPAKHGQRQRAQAGTRKDPCIMSALMQSQAELHGHDTRDEREA